MFEFTTSLALGNFLLVDFSCLGFARSEVHGVSHSFHFIVKKHAVFFFLFLILLRGDEVYFERGPPAARYSMHEFVQAHVS